MADKIGYDDVIEANGTPIPQRYYDNGDGSWARRVSVSQAGSDAWATRGYVQTSGGLWVPLRGESDGKSAISAYGRNVAAGDTAIVVDARGQLQNVLVRQSDGAPVVIAATADGAANGNAVLYVQAEGALFNGASWDRERGNLEGIALASATRSGTTNSADIINYNAAGILVFLNITQVPGTDTITLSIQAKDPAGGGYRILLSGAAQSAVGLTAYLLYPGAGAAAEGINVSRSFPLPRTSRISVSHSAGTNFVYSAAYALIN